MAKSKSFSQWGIEDVVDTFGMTVNYRGQGIEYWINADEPISEQEQQRLSELRERLLDNLTLWNEIELEIFFISPFLEILKMHEVGVKTFLERSLSAQIDDWTISGDVDWIVAQGFGKPKPPFFCLKEFKKAKNSSNDPEGQLAITLLAAQALNQKADVTPKIPVYGAYILGRDWTFCMLKDRHLIQSLPLLPTNEDDLRKMLRILKKLKRIIGENNLIL